MARIFNTYGPRMHPNDGRVVSTFILQALRGKPITVFGDGSQTRSFCYVDDLVGGILALMETDSDPPGPVNLGNPGEFTIGELAEKVIAATGPRSELRFVPLPEDDPKQRCPDIARTRQLLGWEPKVALDEGLGPRIEHFRELLRESGATTAGAEV